MPYHNPALLAKTCATLDVVSHGRSIIGLGAAWHEPEFAAYRWPFPMAPQRLEMLEEAVQIIDLMLRESPARFSGKHYSIKYAYNDPMPVQQPRPPIMGGGSVHRSGRPDLAGVDWTGKRETRSYSDTKLFVTTLMAAVARLRPDVLAHAVDPGWVPTKMGGPVASDELALAHVTQAWLATTGYP